VFPVTGAPIWGDTYGAPRSDVPGGWHHGDDIFATLGTPVVAVADGTLNRVGWERLGGWRLWVRDRVGDEFYYAHLSGYSKLALHATRVKAGDVLGFIGNTGDAFTTIPHLHFEVHPRSLLHLGYDGAVDPTGYLRSWRHVRGFAVGRPSHPPLPTEVAWRAEAKKNFRELLAARGLIHHAVRRQVVQPASRPPIRHPSPAGSISLAAPATPAATSAATTERRPAWLLFAASALGVAFTAVLVWRRRRARHLDQ
jgi:murein DD-endopeptidase MepM/ murein hydrolase activator NlpD